MEQPMAEDSGTAGRDALDQTAMVEVEIAACGSPYPCQHVSCDGEPTEIVLRPALRRTHPTTPTPSHTSHD